MNRIIIAGSNSNVGKTTVTIGIMKAMIDFGYDVVPFKIGPDYIDPRFHEKVVNHKSHNLDSYLLDGNTINTMINENVSDDQIAIIEGVMGLYDGINNNPTIASTAHMAKITKSAIVLVVDGRGISQSIVALLSGYINYDKDIFIAGVIINKVSSTHHYLYLKEIIEQKLSVTCLGCLLFDESISLESRHLGLIPADEVEMLNKKINVLAEHVKETIDIKGIVKAASQSMDLQASFTSKNFLPQFKNKTIAVLKDEAFSFYYQSSLTLLEDCFKEVRYISPLRAGCVGEDIDAVYIGGGFPEVFAKELALNISFLKDLRVKLESGIPCYAECGGLMYLTNSITDLHGGKHKMTGFFNSDSIMTKRLQNFGYISVDCMLHGQKICMKGHEFHRSKIINSNDNHIFTAYKKRDGKTIKQYNCGYKKNNTIALYPHFNFLTDKRFLTVFKRGKENE